MKIKKAVIITGRCGKTTLARLLEAWYHQQGLQVMYQVWARKPLFAQKKQLKTLLKCIQEIDVVIFDCQPDNRHLEDLSDMCSQILGIEDFYLYDCRFETTAVPF